MADNSLHEQLHKYLTDAHSIEVQALAQMRSAPDMAGDPKLAEIFRAHEAETKEHKRLIEERLDAHAIEAQSIRLLEKAPKIVDDPELAKVFEDHLDETRAQQEIVDARLGAYGAGPSRLKDAVMRLGALNWGGFLAAQPDTPGKLAGFAYAFERLEIAGYEELKRVADRAGDQETVRV